MRSLRNFLDRLKPQFEKGGRFEYLSATFEAFESFLFVPNRVTYTGSQIRDHIDMKRTMSVVIVALLPALIFGMYNVGHQHFLSVGISAGLSKAFLFGFLKVLPIIIVSYVVGLAIEFAFAQFRGHEVNEGYLVSGILIPMVMPPDVPLWMVAAASAFAVIFGKEAFGGTGMNIFNPALLARAFIFFAYPAEISGDLAWTAGLADGKNIVDGFSGATPLGLAALGNVSRIPDIPTLFFGLIPGSIGETSKLAILLGAVILLATRIGSWRIMLSGLLGGLAMTLLFNALALNAYMKIDPLTQLLMGSFMFGLVFMATDPVSAAQTNRGKWVYGFLTGMVIIMIRVFNPAYPEGTMLGILLMNAFAPLIDHYVVEGNIKRRLKRAKVAVKS